MTEELQAGIDSMRELIDGASGTDIASSSVRFFRDLFDHIDALQAKLDAVPLQAIAKVFNAADNDDYYNDDVAEWLMENGVQP